MSNPGEENEKEPKKHFPGPFCRNKQQLTPEELRVIKECKKESFYQRSLPFSLILGGATYYSVQKGFLNPNPRFGAAPKVVVAVVLGYCLGKVSYQWKCAEKLMQLPDSPIGAMLRQKCRGRFQEREPVN